MAKTGPKPKSIATRFWEKVDKSGDCWIWTGYTNPAGYGTFGMDRSVKLAHRVAYEMLVVPIPVGMCLCHRCDNPPCVNPAHMFVGTQRDNTNDAMEKRRLQRGSRNGRAKLTEGLVFDIRAMRFRGFPIKHIAEMFEITESTVSSVVNRKTWKHTGYHLGLPP